MKQAAGEANLTVITITLIGVVAAFALLLVPRLLESSQMRGACSAVGGSLNGSTCSILEDGSNVVCFVGKCAEGTNRAGEYVCYGGGSSFGTMDQVCASN